MRRRHQEASTRSIARVLHDELIQSLISTEMRVHAARRRVADTPAADAELSRVERIIHEEILKVRDLMHRIAPIRLEPDDLVDFLADAVAKFGLETGIDARFFSTCTRISLPSRSCAEIARIVQEGLTNARKHAGARQVRVSLGDAADGWLLIIEDDGRGPVATTGIDRGGVPERWLAPVLIKDCVRSLRGGLGLGRGRLGGLRLEISIPRAAERRHPSMIRVAAPRGRAESVGCSVNRS
jgi:two-component system, NarL family, sensor histidine kinase UhpB